MGNSDLFVAHDIRNRSTKQFQAVANLTAKHRWCLTGTPIQNDMDDLGALASFLRVPILEKPPTFRKYITNPINSKSNYTNLRTLLRTICIRRTRDLLDLPEPVVQTRRIPFLPSEKEAYRKLLSECKQQIDMAVSGYIKRTENSTMLESILKLRIFCNNGGLSTLLAIGANGLPTDSDEALTYLQQLSQNTCAYCQAIVYSIDESSETEGGRVMTSCTHLICHICLAGDAVNLNACPACASGQHEIPSLTSSDGAMTQGEGAGQILRYPIQFPSKLQALVSDLREDRPHKR